MCQTLIQALMMQQWKQQNTPKSKEVSSHGNYILVVKDSLKKKKFITKGEFTRLFDVLNTENPWVPDMIPHC